MVNDPRSPIQVLEHDGRIVPFEPERIQHSIFAATERRGFANPFLARELTDAVIHFLNAEPGDRPLPVAELRDTVVKVVRELGFPELSRECVVASSPLRGGVDPPWSPESVAAARDGLIHISGLDAPVEMTGVVLGHCSSIRDALFAAREHAGEFVAIDSPECLLAGHPGAVGARADDFVRELTAAARATGLSVILNLNTATPPSWAIAESGPLFGQPVLDTRELNEIRKELCARVASPGIYVFWHINTATINTEVPCLPSFPSGAQVDYVFDRGKRDIVVGPGLDRSHPAVLAQVGIDVLALAERLGADGMFREAFDKKLASLARFAKSVGHTRQSFLRKHARPSARRGFLLDRARLVVVPVGLAAAARLLLGQSASSPAAVAGCMRELLIVIRDALIGDRPTLLEPVIDTPLFDRFPTPASGSPAAVDLSLDDSTIPAALQLRAARVIHQSFSGRLDLAADSVPFESRIVEACHAGIGRIRRLDTVDHPSHCEGGKEDREA